MLFHRQGRLLFQIPIRKLTPPNPPLEKWSVGFQSTKELLSLIQTKTSDLVSLSHFPFLFGNHINNSKAQVLLSAHGTLERGQFNLGNYIICFVIFAIFCLFLESF